MEGHATSLNFYARPFIHCLYFIDGRKFYLRRHVKLRDSGNPPLETFAMSPPLNTTFCGKIKEKELTAER